MGCLPCCLPSAQPDDNVYATAQKFRALKDGVFIRGDLPFVREELTLEAVGFPNILGRYTPAATQTTTLPVTIITCGGSGGGTTGPLHGPDVNHLAPDCEGLYNDLARRMPSRGVSVLQLAYRHPGPHRFDECVREVAYAASLAAKRGLCILIGHSMGGAIVLASCVEGRGKGLPPARILGVCPLSPQTRGVPSTEGLKLLRRAGLLFIHGVADAQLPPSCSEEIWERLPVAAEEEEAAKHRRLVLLDGTGHNLVESAEEVTNMVFGWIDSLCGVYATKGKADGDAEDERSTAASPLPPDL